MRHAITACLIAIGALLSAGGVQAHHAYTMYDVQREVTLHGVVRGFQWTNPHSMITIVVKDRSGAEVEWAIEGASPGNLIRFGWTRTSLRPGDPVDLVIHPLKDGKIGGSLVRAWVRGQIVGAQGNT